MSRRYFEGGEIPEPTRVRTVAGRLAFERAFDEVVRGDRTAITEARIEEILEERFDGQPGWEDISDSRIWFRKPESRLGRLWLFVWGCDSWDDWDDWRHDLKGTQREPARRS